MMMRRPRPGVVLPIVLMALLIVEILAAGTLALAHMQHSLARERVNALRAQAAARSGTAELAGHWTEGLHQTIRPGTRLVLLNRPLDTHARFTTTLERLSPTLFLVHGNGFAGPAADEARASAGYLIAVHDISELATQFGAALTSVGGVQLSGNAVVSSDQATVPPFGWAPSTCASWLQLPIATPALVVADASTVSAAPTALLTGQPAVLEQTSLPQMPMDQLGPLDFAALRALADRVETGSLQLAAMAVTGTCLVGAPGNWGAPLDQSHPCANYFPFIFAPADLTIVSGAGQGVLIVDGDLTLAAGAQFFGVVLVKGRIVANTGALIAGAAQAGSASPSLLLGASVLRSNCAISRALSLTAPLNRALPRRPRSWIPLY